ncbi:MAG: T9SS type A sorting domain-containing protein [Tannerella sp.]|jgi:hypothetical protein|nr:T9SS type A sorting domain-containing protein [Tannerella sp.]
MKTDLYTKIVLTVIALCLTFNILKDLQIIPGVHADSSKTVMPVNSLSAINLLKANEDGSLNVRLTSSEVVKVEPTSSAEFKVKPASGSSFKVEPASGSEFKVKPASGNAFKVEPDSYARFKVETPPYSDFKVVVENSRSAPLYVAPASNAVFNVKQTNSTSNAIYDPAPVSTYAYPNPAREKINITYNATYSGEYMTICSMEGKVMDHIPLDYSQNEVEINLSKYTSGIYIYNFNGNAGKFIVKK